MTAHGTKRTSSDVRSSVAIGGKPDMAVASADFRVWPQSGSRGPWPGCPQNTHWL